LFCSGVISISFRLVAFGAARPPQRELFQEQHYEQAQSGDRGGDQKHGLQRVRDRLCDPVLRGGSRRVKRVGARLEALRVELSGRRRNLAGEPDLEPACEHRPEERHADRAAERPEKIRRGGGDPDVAPVDGVLDRDDQDLRDHPETESEDDCDCRGRRP
jgi:hypothetical protein